VAAPAPVAAKPTARTRPERPKYSIHCATCGIHAQVPFKPLEGRTVYCQPCYRARGNAGQPAVPPESIVVGDAETGIVE
jgi:CxxC-x17-CxxC domain-containing protein